MTSIYGGVEKPLSRRGHGSPSFGFVSHSLSDSPAPPGPGAELRLPHRTRVSAEGSRPGTPYAGRTQTAAGRAGVRAGQSGRLSERTDQIQKPGEGPTARSRTKQAIGCSFSRPPQGGTGLYGPEGPDRPPP